MPYVVPTARADGYVVDAAEWGKNTVDNPIALKALIDAIVAGASTITTTGTSTALALPSGSGNLVIFANNASLLTLQGIAAGTDGQRLVIVSIGAGQVDLADQNASASAANRIINPVAGTISLAAATGNVTLVYDLTAARWRVVAHDQGAYIDYYASSTIVGWSALTSGRRDLRYKLSGKTLSVIFWLEGTSNATSVTFTLPFAMRASYITQSAPAIRFPATSITSGTSASLRASHWLSRL